METANSSQTRLLYNPQLQSGAMIEKWFIVRKEQFGLLLNTILKEKENSIPQHHLIIGQRGMGKTTMLKRMEIELHKEQYRNRFIPVLYREEQYNVKDLAEFWFNTLDALADSLQAENYPNEMVDTIDKTIQELVRKKTETASTEAYQFLRDTCRELHRRPVLLIDNIDIVFSGLTGGAKNKQEQWALRKLLSENNAPIIIGGGITTIDDVVKYDMPFYDFFKIQYLRKLNYEEFMKLLNNLAIINNSNENVFAAIQQNTSRQKALLELTGGSPRITVILFDQIAKGFSTDINDDLNVLADAITPIYKAKFEELPPQQRIILDAIALNWDAISMRKLTIATRMKNNQLSPQLKRLVDEGWIETIPAYKDKGNAYFISERFFNIYYLIRNSSRRHKDKIYCLSKFLECFYGKEELERISDALLEQEICTPEQMRLHLAVGRIKALEPSKRKKIKEKTNEVFLSNEELRKEFNISESYLHAQEVQQQQPEKTSITDISFEWIRKGLAFNNIHKYEKAIVCYDKALELNPANESAWLWKGNACVRLLRYKDAVTCFNKTLELNPEDENAWIWKGNTLIQLQRHEEAIACYDKVLDLNPENEFAWLWKGNALTDLQRYEEAIACYDKALELNPANESAWLWKGNAWVQLLRYEEAIAFYDKVLELNPANESAWLWKGHALADLQRYEEAIACYDKVLKINLEDEFAWLWKGNALADLQRYEEAIACYDKVLKINPASEFAWLCKGHALIEMREYERAAVAYEQFLSVNAQSLFGKFSLIFLYRDKLYKAEKARELFNSIDKQEVNRSEILLCRYFLNKASFELYDQNKGLAKESVFRAFEVLEKENRLATMANEPWWVKFGSAVMDSGNGAWLLDVLEEKGYDVVLSPYHTAIRALEIAQQEGVDKADIYLNNRAIEIGEPARLIMEKIRKYMD